MNSGTSKRTLVMSRIVAVTAGIELVATNGSAMMSSPVEYIEPTCSQKRPELY